MRFICLQIGTSQRFLSGNRFLLNIETISNPHSYQKRDFKFGLVSLNSSLSELINEKKIGKYQHYNFSEHREYI